eukprot:6197950-Pleurochrysis_carterae.AAC.4
MQAFASPFVSVPHPLARSFARVRRSQRIAKYERKPHHGDRNPPQKSRKKPSNKKMRNSDK